MCIERNMKYLFYQRVGKTLHLMKYTHKLAREQVGLFKAS